jgi:hypothetical protein
MSKRVTIIIFNKNYYEVIETLLYPSNWKLSLINTTEKSC